MRSLKISQLLSFQLSFIFFFRNLEQSRTYTFPYYSHYLPLIRLIILFSLVPNLSPSFKFGRLRFKSRRRKVSYFRREGKEDFPRRGRGAPFRACPYLDGSVSTPDFALCGHFMPPIANDTGTLSTPPAPIGILYRSQNNESGFNLKFQEGREP